MTSFCTEPAVNQDESWVSTLSRYLQQPRGGHGWVREAASRREPVSMGSHAVAASPLSLDECVVARDEHCEAVLGNPPERLGRVDATLIQDRVDAVVCENKQMDGPAVAHVLATGLASQRARGCRRCALKNSVTMATLPFSVIAEVVAAVDAMPAQAIDASLIDQQAGREFWQVSPPPLCIAQ